MNTVFICLEKTELARNVADRLQMPLQEAIFNRFSDGEVNVQLQNPAIFENKKVILFQSTGRLATYSVNDLVLAVAQLAHELKNAGAVKIIAIIPYFGYSRQERSLINQKPGHAAIIAAMLEAAGINELFVVELHDERIMEFFSIPVHNVCAQSIITNHIRQTYSLNDTCLIAPDQGADAYVRAIATKLKMDTLVCSKERIFPDQSRIVSVDGVCKSTVGIIIDDIIATGGTAIDAASTLVKKGYKEIIGYFVHPVLADDAIKRLKESYFQTIYVSNTLPLLAHVRNQSFIRQFDISDSIVHALEKHIG